MIGVGICIKWRHFSAGTAFSLNCFNAQRWPTVIYKKLCSLVRTVYKSSESKLDNRDTRKLLRSVKENRKRSLSGVTDLFNQNRVSAVSIRTVQSTLYKQVYFRRIVLIQNLSGFS